VIRQASASRQHPRCEVAALMVIYCTPSNKLKLVPQTEHE
jgi:hypothetical protein